jgi:hypothetical protein
LVFLSFCHHPRQRDWLKQGGLDDDEAGGVAAQFCLGGDGVGTELNACQRGVAAEGF